MYSMALRVPAGRLADSGAAMLAGLDRPDDQRAAPVRMLPARLERLECVSLERRRVSFRTAAANDAPLTRAPADDTAADPPVNPGAGLARAPRGPSDPGPSGPPAAQPPSWLDILARCEIGPAPIPIPTRDAPPAEDPVAARTDWGQVGKVGLVGALTMGTSFGIPGALGTRLRLTGSTPLRLLAAVIPLASAIVSPYVESGYEQLLGVKGSMPPESPFGWNLDGLAFHSMLPACFMTASALYLRSPLPRLFPGTTLLGAGIGIVCSSSGSGLGRGLMEVWAQHQQAHYPTAPEAYPMPSIDQVASGRAQTQLFGVLVQTATTLLTRGQAYPRAALLAQPFLIGAPYPMRGALTSTERAEGSAQS